MDHNLEKMSVEQVLDQFGLTSEEFFFKIRRLIAFVLSRHFKSKSEDHFQDALASCYCKVLETLTARPYDPKAGNLRTYIYTIARNECSTLGYHDRRNYTREAPLEDVGLEGDGYALGTERAADPRFCIPPDETHDAPAPTFRVWRTVLGAYCYEAGEAVQRLLKDEAPDDEIAEGLCPRSRAAFRVLLWHRQAEGSFV